MIKKERECCKQEETMMCDLPCAGITLIRFYGYDLSLVLLFAGANTPGTID